MTSTSSNELSKYLIHSGQLPTEDGLHDLYYERYGNPNGFPIVFLHGGPARPIGADDLRFFDPETQHIVLFHQRGCGRSTPLGGLQTNTTAACATDIEQIRRTLGIAKWTVVGFSWGTPLGLLYAETYPESCRSLLFCCIYFGSPEEIAWYYEGLKQYHPRGWQRFADFVGVHRGRDIPAAYLPLLLDPDPSIHDRAAREWNAYPHRSEDPVLLEQDFTEDASVALARARIQCQYVVADNYLPLAPDLLHAMDRIRQIPTIMVHGADLVVSKSSYISEKLEKFFPEADLKIVPDAGYSICDHNIVAVMRSSLKTLQDEGAKHG